MHFLNPLFLLGLAASSVPLLIHLLTRRRPRRTEFSSVEFLREARVVEGTRWLFSRTPPTSYRAAPTLGQDGFDILTDLLGYDVDRVADLAAAELLE